MATFLNKSYFNGYNGSHFYLELWYEVISQSVANNTSTFRLLSYVGSQDGYSGSGATNYIYPHGNGINSNVACGSFDNIPVNTKVGPGYSETYTMYHNNEGKLSLDVYTTCNGVWNGLGSATARGTINFPIIERYPIITQAPNFTDEEDPTITYTTTLGFEGATVEAGIFSSDGNIAYADYRTISVGNGSYTFELTSTERNNLRNATPNSSTMSVMFKIKTTTTNNVEYLSTLIKTMTIINANPTFTYTIEETNAKVISLLGNNSANTIISNASILEFDIVPTAYKGATITNVICGDRYDIMNRQNKETSPYVFDIPVKENNTFLIVAYDSRFFSTSINDIQKTLLNYKPVLINNYSFKRQSPISSNVILNGDFNYWGNVGNYTNTPVVKYKLDNGSWITIPSTEYTIDSTNHKLTISDCELTNVLPYNQVGQFSISIEDALTSKQDTNENYGKVLKGVPSFDVGEHDFKVNGDLYVADINGDNAVNVLEEIEKASLEVYSTTETVIGEWIDGKPLYRKVISGTKTTTGESNIALNTSNIDKYVTVDAKIVRSATETRNGNTTPYYMSSSDYWNYYLKTPQSNTLSMRGGTSWPQVPYNYVIILEYTKTTD